MRGYLLDTNVLSELVRKNPSPKVVGQLRAWAAKGWRRRQSA